MDFKKEKKKNTFKIYSFISKTTDIPRKSLKKKKKKVLLIMIKKQVLS